MKKFIICFLLLVSCSSSKPTKDDYILVNKYEEYVDQSLCKFVILKNQSGEFHKIIVCDTDPKTNYLFKLNIGDKVSLSK